MNIVVANMSRYIEWESGIKNRNGKMLQELASRDDVNRIICIDFLPFSYRTKLSWIKRSFLDKQRGKTIAKGLGYRVYQPQSSDFLKNKDKLVVISAFSASSLKKSLRSIPETIDMVWSYNPFLEVVYDWFSSATKVFTAVDDWSLHPAYSKYAKKLNSNYAAINKKVDHIFTVSESLIQKFTNSNTTWLANGVDADFFLTHNTYPLKEFLPETVARHIDSGKKVVGYVGTIESRVNLDLLKKCSKDHQDKIFLIAGPIWKDVKGQLEEQFEGQDNIYFVGRVEYKYLPSLLKHYDVGIIPHHGNAFMESMDPLKLYDYLAAGIPVVTTPSGSTKRFSDYVYLGKGDDEFSECIGRAIAEDSDALHKKRQDLMQNHTWKKRLDRAMQLIQRD